MERVFLPSSCLALAAVNTTNLFVLKKVPRKGHFLLFMLAILGWLLFLLAWIQPHHFRPWLNFYAEALAIMGVSFLVLHQIIVSRMAVSYKITRITGILGLVATLPWFYYVFGVGFFAGDALVVSIFLLTLVAAVALGGIYTDHSEKSAENLRAFFYVTWLAAMISACVGIIQWLSLSDYLGSLYVTQMDVDERASGNMGQPNQLASLLLMGIAALTWIYERERTRIGIWGYGFSLGFLTIALVLSQSRAGVLSASIMVAWIAWKNYRKTNCIRPWHAFAWVISYFLLLKILPYLQDALLMSVARDTSMTRDNGRIIMWQQTWAGIMEAPWFGYGWNQTPTAHAAGSIAYPGRLTFTNAHNVVLDILAWTGIPMGVLLTCACLYWFCSRMLAVKNSTSVYAMAGLIPIATHSMLEYPFAYAYFLVAAGFFIGIVEGAYPKALQLNLKRIFLIPSVLLFFVVGGRIIYEYMIIEEDFRVVRFENLRIGKTPLEYEVPQNIILLSQEGVMLKASRIRAHRNMSREALENLRMAALRFPYGSLGLRYAMALGLNGDPQGATQFMQVVYGMYGPGYYRAAVETLRSFQAEEFPELAAVQAP